MKITFTNERGSITFSGGGKLSGFRLTSVSGLDLPDKERALTSYVGRDGVTERSAQFGQRVITISGDLADADIHKTAIQRAIHIFSHKGILKIVGEEKSREIAVDSTCFSLGERKGSYQIFCAQFTCDFPHFTDGNEYTQGIYSRINQIRADKALPYIFTQRTGNSTTVVNCGNVSAEPVFVFEGINPEGAEGNIQIMNRTTGKEMQINYALQAGETLCLDVPARTLISSVQGNVAGRIDRDSFFSDMYLVPGENELAVTGQGANVNMSSGVRYAALYTEAVV